jgi:hypothetical protein
VTPYYDEDGRVENMGRFRKGVSRGPHSDKHKAALSEALKRSWARGRGGLGFGKGSGVVRPIGSTHVNRQGYLMEKVSLSPGQSYRLQHVVVMERAIGRALAPSEVVHHIDGNRRNNDISNLYLCRDRSHHNEVHKTQDAALRALLAAGLVRFRDGA